VVGVRLQVKRLVILFLLLVSCSTGSTQGSQSQTKMKTAEPLTAESTMEETPATITAYPTFTRLPDATRTSPAPETAATNPPDATATSPQALPEPTREKQDWRIQPVIPEIDPYVIDIYQAGQALGNNPNAFSKIGDCESTPTWFLGDFDLGPRFYDLGPYQFLEGVIEQFQGSFNRTSLAAFRGFTASSALTPLWSDKKQCQSNETPLACEYRVHRPVIALIMLGTNDVYHQENFESHFRQIIETTLEQGIIPILATKADNLEGDERINTIISDLAWEYRVPLWNFWLAVQELPDHGLQPDGSHLTWDQNMFNEPGVFDSAWPVRNLTALQILDATWQAIHQQAAP